MMKKLIDKIKGFKELKPNWDSYGADPIPEKVINKAIEIIEKLEFHNMNLDYVFPMRDGGLQFEVKSGKFNDIELLIGKNLVVELVIYNNENDIIEERKIINEEDLLFVVDVLNLIKNNIEYK